MTKKQVTLLMHADLARDLGRLVSDAVVAEKLNTMIESNLREWMKVNKQGTSRKKKKSSSCSLKSRQRLKARNEKRLKFQEFGKLVSETRQHIGLSQVAAADKLGWQHEFLVASEVGRRLLTIRNLNHFAHELGLSLEQRRLLVTKLKELAPFLVRTKAKVLRESTCIDHPDNACGESLRESEPSPTNSNQPNLPTLAWTNHASKQKDLTPLSLAIFESVGIRDEQRSFNLQRLQENHPHVLHDCTKKSLEGQPDSHSVNLAIEQSRTETNNEFFIALGKAIKERRNELGLRRRDLAEKSQLLSKQIRRVEVGSEISVEDMFKIAEALDLEPVKLAQRAQEFIAENFQVG